MNPVPAASVPEFAAQVLSLAWDVRRSLAEPADIRELYQEGWVALLRCWTASDPEKAVGFPAIARQHIRGSMRRSIGEGNAPRPVSSGSRRDLERPGRGSRLEALVRARIGMSGERLELPERAVYLHELLGLVAHARLGPRQAALLRLHYWSNVPLGRIGQMIGVSPVRASRIHTAALRKLRGVLIEATMS